MHRKKVNSLPKVTHNKQMVGLNLADQQLGFCISTAGGMGSIPGQGTNSHVAVTQPENKKK